MKKYTFTGTATIKNKFSLDVYAKNYEQAEEMAFEILDDPEDEAYEQSVSDMEVDILEYTEEPLRPRRYTHF